MQDELQAIKNAAEQGDLEAARSLSDSFVAANDSLFMEMRTKSVTELVAAVDAFRETGMEQNQWEVEAWLYHHYEPQNIGGSQDATVRIS